MDLDSGKKSICVREQPREEPEVTPPEPVPSAMQPEGVQPWIDEGHLERRTCSGVVRARGPNVLDDDLRRVEKLSCASCRAKHGSKCARSLALRLRRLPLPWKARFPGLPGARPKPKHPTMLRLAPPKLQPWRQVRREPLAAYRVFEVCRVELEDGAGRRRGDAFTLRGRNW